jgi:hypothetical protein
MSQKQMDGWIKVSMDQAIREAKQSRPDWLPAQSDKREHLKRSGGNRGREKADQLREDGLAFVHPSILGGRAGDRHALQIAASKKRL